MIDSGVNIPRHLHRLRVMWLRFLFGSILLLGAFPRAVFAEELAKSETPALQLEAPAELLIPQLRRSAGERHRLDAIAHFSAGRMLEHKGEFPEALRHYERSARYDDMRLETYQRIIVLSRSLNRHEETARYALALARRSQAEPIYLLLASIYLKQTERYDEALTLYELALQQPHAPAKTAAWVELHKSAGEFYLLRERYPQAIRALAHVEQALEKPEDYELSGDTLKLVLGDEAALQRLFGEAYLLADKPIRAVAAFERADRAAPGEGLLLYQLARVDRRIGDPDRAIAKLEKYMAGKHETLGLAPYRLLEEVLVEEKRSDELIERLQAAQARDKKNDKLAYFLGEKLLAGGDLPAARSLLEQAIAEEPTANAYASLAEVYRAQQAPPALLRLLADIAARSGSLELLDAQLAAIAADKPLVDALLALARERMKALQEANANGEEAEAAEGENPFHILGEADAPAGDNFAVPLAAAWIAGEAGRHDAAGKFFTAAIEADPERRTQVLLGWGLSLMFDKEYSRAAAVFRQGVQAPTPPLARPNFYFYLAGSLAMEDKFDEALDAAEKAVALRSNSAEYRARVCWLLYRAGKLRESAEAYEQLLTDYHNEYYAGEIREVVRDARLALSNIYIRQDKLIEGTEQLERVLDEYPEDAGASNDLGYLWADRDMRLDMAEELIRRAIEAEPENLSYRDSLGWVLYRLQRYPEALEQLELAVKTEQPNAVVHDHLGDILMALNRPAEATAAWHRAVELYDENETEQKQRTKEKIKSNSTGKNGKKSSP